MSFNQSVRQQDTKAISRMITTLQEHMMRFGYQPLETPIIEPTNLFLTRAGDQVINKLFTFTRHGQELTLRPEFTAIAAHYFVHHRQQAIARWQFNGPVFVDDPHNFRQDYQQYSIGAELIGLAGAAIDAEMIGLAFQGLKQVSIPGCQLVAGHIGLTRELLRRFQLDNRTEQFLLRHIDALGQPTLGKSYVLEQFEYSLIGTANANIHPHPALQDALTWEQAEVNTQQMLQSLLDATQRGATMGGRTQHDIARRLLQKQQRLTERQQVRDALDFLESWTGIQAPPAEAFRAIAAFIPDGSQAAAQFRDWQDTIELLDIYGVDLPLVVIQPYLARNWAYYTGIVFEMNIKNGAQVASGGRYDELIALSGAKQGVPAVGFAYYLDPLLDYLESPSSNGTTKIYIPLVENNARAASQWAANLRIHHLTAILMPSDRVDDDCLVIEAAADGRIMFDGQQFTIQTVEALVAAIRQKINAE